MTINAAQLLVKVNADTSAAQAGLGGMATLLGPGGVLGLGAIGLAVAIAGIGIASTKMAGDFQSGLVTLVTGAGEAQSNLGMIHDGILQMATATGESTSQLVQGLYMIESAGYHGKAGLDILKAAAEGAKVGNADLGVTADAVTTIMVNYGATGLSAAQATNTLIATVANGKTHLQDLATALSSVLPTARQAGVGLNDVMAAMAAQTAAGVPAADAATHLRQMIIALLAPSSQAKKALADVGLTTDQVAAAMHKSLPGAVQMITDAIGKKFKPGSAEYLAALKEISGGSREMQGMLALSGDGMKRFGSDAKLIAGQVKQGGNSIEGWNLVQGTFNQKMSVLVQTVETLMIKLGEKLLPIVGRLVDALAKNLVPTINNVGNLFKFLHDHLEVALPVLGLVGGIIASIVVPALIGMATAAWAAIAPMLVAAAPFIAVGLAIGLLAGGIYLLITHWKQISAWLEGVWKKTVDGVAAGFSWLYNHNKYIKLLVDEIVADFNFARNTIMHIWNAVVGFFTGLKTRISDSLDHGVLKPIKDGIAGIISTAESWGGNLIKMLIKGIQGQVSALKNAAGDVMKGLANILGFHSPTKEGPGQDADTWAPNLMRMFAGGILAAAPTLASAASAVMSGVRVALSSGGGSLSLSGASGGSTSGSSNLAALPAGAGGGSGGRQVIEIHLTTQLDSRVVARQVLQVAPQLVQFATGHKNGGS